MISLLMDIGMYIYILGFFSGAVTITLNFLYIKKENTTLPKKLLAFNLSFLLYMIINFVIFFGRIFSLGNYIHSLILVIFDLSYIAFTVTWICYLSQLSFNKMHKPSIITMIAAGFLYILLWSIVYFNFLDLDDHVAGTMGKALSLAAEIVVFAASAQCTAFGMLSALKAAKQKRLLILLPSGFMLLYFIYYLIYEIDAIFRFIGPSAWSTYPLDGLMFLYLIMNLFHIIFLIRYLYSEINLEKGNPKDFPKAILKLSQQYKLTKREQEILVSIMQGKNNSQIAEDHVISIYTVKRHINNINHKTGKQNKDELIQLVKENL